MKLSYPRSVIYPLKYRGPTYIDENYTTYGNMPTKIRDLMMNNTSSEELNLKTDQIKNLGQGFTIHVRTV